MVKLSTLILLFIRTTKQLVSNTNKLLDGGKPLQFNTYDTHRNLIISKSLN